MKHSSFGMAAACIIFTLTPAMAFAGPIQQACMSAPRKSGNWNLCGCIQRVADQTLTRSDQKIAAKFFSEPQKAQDMRQSDSTRHEEFWRRYKEFGVSAAASCN